MKEMREPLKILYEDNHCIAVVKPHGILTQGDDTGDRSLFDEVKDFIKERDQKPGNVFLGLVQRLDRPVGGVVVFAKTSKGAARLAEQFRVRETEKKYLALVEGELKKKQGTVTQYLRKNHVTNTVEALDQPTSEAQLAELSYQVIKSIKQNDRIFSLVAIEPKTGRSHQIRVAMSSLGTPIVGDKKYGSKVSRGGRIALCAVSLSFDQPVTHERITVETEPDNEVFKI
ncbi:MAG: RluA family pseudouridine synthase [Candidatus Uhrbacteria bacterium]